MKIPLKLAHSATGVVTFCFDGCLVCCPRLGTLVISQNNGPVSFFIEYQTMRQNNKNENCKRVLSDFNKSVPANLRRVTSKPVFGVFDQVQHPAGCTTTENG